MKIVSDFEFAGWKITTVLFFTLTIILIFSKKSILGNEPIELNKNEIGYIEKDTVFQIDTVFVPKPNIEYRTVKEISYETIYIDKTYNDNYDCGILDHND